MNLKKKLVVGMSTLAVGAALIGGGTFAFFNDTATSAGNTIATGTLSIDHAGVETFNINASNQAPGDEIARTLTITNTGSLDEQHQISLENFSLKKNGATVSPSTLTHNGADAYVLVTDAAGTVIVDTAHGINKLDKWKTLHAAGGTTPADSEALTVKIGLSTAADNTYQGLTVGGDIKVSSEQVKNNPKTNVR